MNLKRIDAELTRNFKNNLMIEFSSQLDESCEFIVFDPFTFDRVVLHVAEIKFIFRSNIEVHLNYQYSLINKPLNLM